MPMPMLILGLRRDPSEDGGGAEHGSLQSAGLSDLKPVPGV
jgi:hypothetical protein